MECDAAELKKIGRVAEELTVEVTIGWIGQGGAKLTGINISNRCVLPPS